MIAIERRSRVPVAELRAEFEASGLTPHDLAVRLGWYRPQGWVDAGRVTRALGLRHYNKSRGYGPATRCSVNAKTAQDIRAAMCRVSAGIEERQESA